MNTIIAVSGFSGSGKSTLVHELCKDLNAVSLFFDAYQKTTVYPPDMMSRLATGQHIDPVEVKSPNFLHDLKSLKKGKTVIDPWGRVLTPSSKYIVIEEPFGRLREGMADVIDCVVYIDTPADVSLARRLLRDIKFEYKELDANTTVKLIEEYLTSYLFSLGKGYELVCAAVKQSADLVINGLKDVQFNSQQIVEMVKKKDLNSV
jgi:uridine kinase